MDRDPSPNVDPHHHTRNPVGEVIGIGPNVVTTSTPGTIWSTIRKAFILITYNSFIVYSNIGGCYMLQITSEVVMLEGQKNRKIEGRNVEVKSKKR